jgi:hypothetical protein
LDTRALDLSCCNQIINVTLPGGDNGIATDSYCLPLCMLARMPHQWLKILRLRLIYILKDYEGESLRFYF